MAFKILDEVDPRLMSPRLKKKRKKNRIPAAVTEMRCSRVQRSCLKLATLGERRPPTGLHNSLLQLLVCVSFADRPKLTRRDDIVLGVLETIISFSSSKNCHYISISRMILISAFDRNFNVDQS